MRHTPFRRALLAGTLLTLLAVILLFSLSIDSPRVQAQKPQPTPKLALSGYQYFFPVAGKACQDYCVGWTISGAPDVPVILHTTDGGTTWSVQGDLSPWSSYTSSAISAVDAQTAWATLDKDTTQGAILHTIDGGKTWVSQTLPSGIIGGMKGVKGLSRNVAWAASLGGTILKTTNGGVTWTIVPHATIPITQVNRMDALNQDVWIVDHSQHEIQNEWNAVVIHTQDNGNTWRQEILPEVLPLGSGSHNISAYSPLVVWSVAWASGDFYRTLDGGVHWVKVAPGVSGPNDFDGLCAASPETVWGVQYQGGSGIIYRVHVATDGTVDAQSFNPTPNTYYESVTCWDDRVAWVVGTNLSTATGVILHTRDGGAHWTQQTMPVAVGLLSVSFVGARR